MDTKRLLLGAAVLMLLGGCPVTDPDAGRLEVNDDLRRACEFMPDDFIATVITWAEADRIAGFSFSDELQAIRWSCMEDTSDPIGCEICGDAIVRQVYLGL